LNLDVMTMGVERSKEVEEQAKLKHRKGLKVLQNLVKGQDNSGRVTLAFRSAHFGTYLRMDGRDLVEGGPGEVLSQSYVGLWELFHLVPQNDGTVAIQSLQFDAWLRMDATDVKDEPGGVVNCQSFVGVMERFYMRSQEDGSVAIQSAKFGTYLRMDSIGVSLHPQGGGTVNCSREVRSWEKFFMQVIQPIFGIKLSAHALYLRMDCHDGIGSEEANIVSGQTYFGDWEKFAIIWQEEGLVGIKSLAFREYLSAQDDGTRLGRSSSLGRKEGFTMVLQQDGSIAFKLAVYNLYLSMSRGAVVSLTPNLGETERFELIIES